MKKVAVLPNKCDDEFLDEKLNEPKHRHFNVEKWNLLKQYYCTILWEILLYNFNGIFRVNLNTILFSFMLQMVVEVRFYDNKIILLSGTS